MVRWEENEKPQWKSAWPLWKFSNPHADQRSCFYLLDFVTLCDSWPTIWSWVFKCPANAWIRWAISIDFQSLNWYKSGGWSSDWRNEITFSRRGVLPSDRKWINRVSVNLLGVKSPTHSHWASCPMSSRCFRLSLPWMTICNSSELSYTSELHPRVEFLMPLIDLYCNESEIQTTFAGSQV